MSMIAFPRRSREIKFTDFSKSQTGEPLELKMLETQEEKNQHLINMLNSINQKTITQEDIKKHCINELRAICLIQAARGDIQNAWDKIMPFYEDNTNSAIDILSLFTNRNIGYFGEQNITRTGAKYTQVLIQILHQIDFKCLESEFNPSELDSLSEVLLESNKWYRGNYIKNVKVAIDENHPDKIPNINIMLGRSNGTMGTNNNLSINFQPNQAIIRLLNSNQHVEDSADIKRIPSKYCNVVITTDGLTKDQDNYIVTVTLTDLQTRKVTQRIGRYQNKKIVSAEKKIIKPEPEDSEVIKVEDFLDFYNDCLLKPKDIADLLNPKEKNSISSQT